MSKAADKSKSDLPIEGLILECNKDRYKLAYASLRWAKEIKQKENLPDPIPLLMPRALREILTGDVSIKDVEKLPMIKKSTPPPPQVQPTLTLKLPEADAEPASSEE